MPLDENRETILNILDEEDCWTHVIIHYLNAIRSSVYVTYKADGTPDLRNPASRVMQKLAEALNYEVTTSGMKDTGSYRWKCHYRSCGQVFEKTTPQLLGKVKANHLRSHRR